jgi:hypothetical protein
VQQYPAWRPKLDKVSIDSITEATLDEGKRVVFVEHSKRHRRTVILHVEQQPLKTMLRVLEERITTAVSLRSPVPTRPHVPTFSGSWTFELKYPDQNLPSNKSVSQVVQLKITEQGVIKKPLVRLSNMLLFGYHRRIDRFMKDLERKIEQDQVIDHDISNNNNNDTPTALTTTTIGDDDDDQENGQRVEGNRSQQKSADDDNSCTGVAHDEGQVTQSLLNNNLLNMDIDASMYDSTLIDRVSEEQQQQPSRSLEKDWDLVSEIYERQKV